MQCLEGKCAACDYVGENCLGDNCFEINTKLQNAEREECMSGTEEYECFRLVQFSGPERNIFNVSTSLKEISSNHHLWGIRCPD